MSWRCVVRFCLPILAAGLIAGLAPGSAEGREVRHIGPVAQDWHAAFRLNDDPLTINQGDFDGVNLAAIQALERRTAELLARVEELEATIRRLTAEAEPDR